MVTVYHSYEKWLLSGVSSWTVNLAQGMRDTRYANKVLFTGLAPGRQPKLDSACVDYEYFDRRRFPNRKQEWNAFKLYLQGRAPCIYIPNFDFHRNCVAGILESGVKVCAIVHSDEHCYYDMLERHGSDCDAIVCVSSYLQRYVKERFPALASRVYLIPYGVPEITVSNRIEEHPQQLRLAYCNRLTQYQKRVFELPLILAELERLKVPYRLTIAGSGTDETRLMKQFSEQGLLENVEMLGEVSNERVLELLKESDMFLLVSDFEGLPLSLLEAMMSGCIPVAYRISSGISDAILPGKTGMLVRHGDPFAFASTIAELWANQEKRKRISMATAEFASRAFSARRMVMDYTSLFDNLVGPENQMVPVVRSGRIRPPQDLLLLHRLRARFRELVGKDSSDI